MQHTQLDLPDDETEAECPTCSKLYSTRELKGRIVHLPVKEMIKNVVYKTNAGSVIANNCFHPDGSVREEVPTPHGILYDLIRRKRGHRYSFKVCPIGYNLISDVALARGTKQDVYVLWLQLTDLSVGFEASFIPAAYCVWSKTSEWKPNPEAFFTPTVLDLCDLYVHPIDYVWTRPDGVSDPIKYLLEFNSFVADTQERSYVLGMLQSRCHFPCHQCEHFQHKSTDELPYDVGNNFNRYRYDCDFTVIPRNPANTGIDRDCVLAVLPGFSYTQKLAFEPLHNQAGGVLKAENEFLLTKDSTKQTSAMYHMQPLVKGQFLQWVLEQQERWPIPETLPAAVSATGVKFFYAKDHLSFFVTQVPFILRNLSNLTERLHDDEAYVYSRMMGSLHFLQLLYHSYKATDYVNEIDILAHDYIDHAVQYHGRRWTTFNWHAMLHLAMDVLRHGPPTRFGAFYSELMFKTVRKLINCYHQQLPRLTNRRFYLMGIDITTNRLKPTRWALGSRLLTTIDETSLDPQHLVIIKNAVLRRHPESQIKFYGKMIHDGFVVQTRRAYETLPKSFSDTIVTTSQNWFGVDVILEVRNSSASYIYCWGCKYIPELIQRPNTPPTFWTPAIVPQEIPTNTIRQHYFFGSKSAVYRLVPAQKIYATAYAREERRTLADSRYILISIPIKGVI